jgi:hypothetical protein
MDLLKFLNARNSFSIKTARYPFGTVEYLEDYYPCSRYSKAQISRQSCEFRESIWRFKDGIVNAATDNLVKRITDRILSIDGINNGTWSIFLVPASSREKTLHRYDRLINRLKSQLSNVEFLNDRVCFIGSRAPKHNGCRNGSSTSHFLLDSAAAGSNVLIVDDIVTTGQSMQEMTELIGAGKHYKFLAMGRTVYKTGRF